VKGVFQKRGACIDRQAITRARKSRGKKRPHPCRYGRAPASPQLVHPASIQDRELAALFSPWSCSAACPFLKKLFADCGLPRGRVFKTGAEEKHYCLAWKLKSSTIGLRRSAFEVTPEGMGRGKNFCMARQVRPCLARDFENRTRDARAFSPWIQFV